MNHHRILGVAVLAVLLLMATRGVTSEPNPKSYVATASGTNAVLAAQAGRGYTIHAVAIQASDQATAKVGVYVASTTEDLIGSATASVPIDKTGVDGYAGFTWQYNPIGWAAAPIGEPVNIVLSGAQPVIVNIVYSLR